MEDVLTAAPRGKAITIVTWGLRIVLGLAFLAAAAMKLSGQPAMVAEFELVGLGQWFRYFTAIVEIVGGVAILAPRVSVLGALLLLAVDAGAFLAQVTAIHMDWVHTIVIGALLVLLIFLQRRDLTAILANRR